MYPLIRTGLFQRSFRAMSPKVRSMCNAQALLNKDFYPHFSRDNLPRHKTLNLDLKFSILQHAYNSVLKHDDTPSLLFKLIESIPETLSLDAKLQWFSNKLFTYPAMPVITAHPTRVLSNEAMVKLTHIIDNLILLKQKKIPFEHVSAFKAQLAESIQTWVRDPIVPSTNLTPEDEAEFALFLYKRILATFPEFRQQVIQKFRHEHGGSETLVAHTLNDAIMMSYRHVFSWCMADFDGNDKRTKKTLETTLPSQQRAILELYTTSLARILKKLNEAQHPAVFTTLKEMHKYFNRCAHEAIQAGILFDLTASQKAKKRAKSDLENIASELSRSEHLSDKALVQEIYALHDLIDLAGFFGGLKEYIRQTTHLNQRVLSDLVTVLAIYHKDIQSLMQNRSYTELPLAEKQNILRILRTKPRYFETLKQHTSWLQAETLQEMDRLSFVLNHNDLYRSYIGSETANKDNFDEVLILAGLAAYLVGSLRIGQIREYAFNPMPLFETRKDLERAGNVVLEMFEDPSIRNIIMTSGFFSYVGGPSDLGKESGLFVYFPLLQNQLRFLEILKAYQQTDPSLMHVTLRVLHGFGGDLKRRNGSSANELHSTQQGLEAWRVLGATGAYPAFLHRVAGLPSESYLRAQELARLQVNHPEAFNALNVMENASMTTYQTFMSSQENKNLLVKLTSLSLEKRLNISSRAGSKINFEDPTNIRAIGVVNLYLITGISWDIFMSAVGLLDLPEDTTKHFPCLFNELTTMQDIVYKILFAIAVSNFPRAWERINNKEDVSLHATLAHIETSAARILMQSMLYFSPEQQKQATSYLREANQNKRPVHEMALGLMDALGGDSLERLAKETRELLPHFERAADCIDMYRNNPTPEHIENAILALRGMPLAAGPDCITELTSQLREEQLIPQEKTLTSSPP